jgi:hypothetical protein
VDLKQCVFRRKKYLNECVCVCVKIGTFPIINKINVKISESKNTTVCAYSGHKYYVSSVPGRKLYVLFIINFQKLQH